MHCGYLQQKENASAGSNHRWIKKESSDRQKGYLLIQGFVLFLCICNFFTDISKINAQFLLLVVEMLVMCLKHTMQKLAKIVRF